MSQVVVVTSKKKMRSNTLPFMFIPARAPSIRLKNNLSSFTVEDKKPQTCSPTLSASPQADTSSSHCSSISDLTDVFATHPSSPTDDVSLSSILDICVESLDMKVEEKILPTATLPATSLPVQGSFQLFGVDNIAVE